LSLSSGIVLFLLFFSIGLGLQFSYAGGAIFIGTGITISFSDSFVGCFNDLVFFGLGGFVCLKFFFNFSELFFICFN
jgi:hypothetical protein